MATVVRCIVHHVNGRERDTEQNDDAQHRSEKRVQFARRRSARATVDLCIDALRTHEFLPLSLVWARTSCRLTATFHDFGPIS
jgi:hypothetical protein